MKMNNTSPTLTPQLVPVDPTQPDPNTWYRSKFSKRTYWIIGLAVVVVVVAGLSIYFTSRSISSSAGNLFDQALSNALHTKNFTQENASGPSRLSIKYDVSVPSNTKVQAAGNLNQGDNVTAFNGYGTFQDTYIKFTTFTTAGKSVPPAALDKWFQVRKAGFDASNGYFAVVFQNDPHAAFFGDLIFGNFSKSDRDKLLIYLRQYNVYRIDSTKIQHINYRGERLAAYQVIEDKAALAGFNKLVGKMVNLPASELAQDINNLHFAGQAKVYISESTKQFVGVEVGATSIKYTNFGTTALGEAPTPQTTFEQFENLVATNPTSATPM